MKVNTGTSGSFISEKTYVCMIACGPKHTYVVTLQESNVINLVLMYSVEQVRSSTNVTVKE